MAFRGQRLNPSEQPWDSTTYTHPHDPNLSELHRSMDYNKLGEPILRARLSGVDTTSKNRVKVSQQEIVLFSNALYSTDPEIWDRAVYNNATVTYDSI
jgi:hypothetical protein